ncbi:MAG: hypothetical protein MUC77_16005 [Chromatiaceae bacterium]|jgi:hypothetical protein|nr:hypothetical protein [Chromatiaceae bacterium]
MTTEGASPMDEDAAEAEAMLRAGLYRGQRLPTIADVQEFQERFGLSHVATNMVRIEIVEAGRFYFSHEHPPTPKAQAKQLADVRKKADARMALT